jgi:hypothetical protein
MNLRNLLTGMTANQKLFGNAAGTDIEWSKGIYYNAFSKLINVGGDVAYTGVGFKPSFLMGMASIDSVYSDSFGVSDGINNRSMATLIDGLSKYNNAYFIFFERSAAFATGITAIVQSFDNDGFTLRYVISGFPPANAMVVTYVAFR